MYLLSADRAHWVTRDGGASYRALTTPVRLAPDTVHGPSHALGVHPTNEAWLLAVGTDPRCDPDRTTCAMQVRQGPVCVYVCVFGG
jgi:hypothetical protein